MTEGAAKLSLPQANNIVNFICYYETKSWSRYFPYRPDVFQNGSIAILMKVLVSLKLSERRILDGEFPRW